MSTLVFGLWREGGDENRKKNKNIFLPYYWLAFYFEGGYHSIEGVTGIGNIVFWTTSPLIFKLS